MMIGGTKMICEINKKNKRSLIKLADGAVFKISPQESSNSPFDGIKTLFNIRSEQILSALRETREEN